MNDPENKKKRRLPGQAYDFDSEGIQRALLAALEAIYQSTPHLTLPQFLIALEVMTAERDGQPHTLVTLVKKLDMPFSTASRVAWSLTPEGGDIGVIKYVPHPTDRRKKLLTVNSSAFDKAFPKAMHRALVDYYGDSILGLRRVLH
jgi:DNA-binding MarR family transcriptional regulator